MSKGFYKAIRNLAPTLTQVANNYHVKSKKMSQYMKNSFCMKGIYIEDLKRMTLEEKVLQLVRDPYSKVDAETCLRAVLKKHGYEYVDMKERGKRNIRVFPAGLTRLEKNPPRNDTIQKNQNTFKRAHPYRSRTMYYQLTR